MRSQVQPWNLLITLEEDMVVIPNLRIDFAHQTLNIVYLKSRISFY